MFTSVRRAARFVRENPIKTSVVVGFTAGIIVTRYTLSERLIPDVDHVFIHLNEKAVDAISKDGGVWLNSNLGKFFLTTEYAIENLAERKIVDMQTVS